MNDNDPRNGSAFERRARQAAYAAARCAEAIKGETDPDTVSELIKATAKYANRAVEDDRQAREERS